MKCKSHEADQWPIKSASFDEILPIWRDQLWPGRESKIEPVSAIGLDGAIDLGWLESRPVFWQIQFQGETVGVLGALLLNNMRLRGLWVSESVRGLGLGRRLVENALATAGQVPVNLVWTMARHEAVPFYLACGLKKAREVVGYEFGPHVLMEKQDIGSKLK